MFAIQFFQKALGGADGFVVAEFGGWGEEAVFGVVDDFGDGLFGFGGGIGFGQVAAGDLEAVEEQAGAARVDLVGGDALEDFGEALLDGAAVFRKGEREAGAAAARAGVLDGAARVVVEVAEVFVASGRAEGGAAAAAAVGEDVAALQASVVVDDLGRHGYPRVLVGLSGS